MDIESHISGYVDEDINVAVKRVTDKGSMSTLNSSEEG